jgi:hypothetical protein
MLTSLQEWQKTLGLAISFVNSSKGCPSKKIKDKRIKRCVFNDMK